MIAAIRSRLECRASENTPRLPVDTVRNIFSDKRTIADPTEASAAICFGELWVRVRMSVPEMVLFALIIRRCAIELALRVDARATQDKPSRNSSFLLQRRRRHERRAPRLAMRPAHFDLFE